jgi:hypothetical protein
MKNLRRVLIGIVSTSLLLVASSSGAMGIGEVDQSTRPTEPSFAFTIEDDIFSGYGAFSSISGAARGGFTTNLACTSVEDTNCSSADNLNVIVVLPPCAANSLPSDVCVKSLRTADSSGALQPATLEYEAKSNRFAQDNKYSIPGGGGVSVWKGASSTGGTLDYSVAVTMQIAWHRSPQGASGNKVIYGYSAQVIPIKIKTGNYYPATWKSSVKSFSIEPDVPAGAAPSDNWFDCIFVDLGRCAMRDTFHPDQKIELSMQMDNAITGWIFGRMKDTQASSVPLAKNTTLLTIEGASINVPNGLAWIPLSAIKDSPGLQEIDWSHTIARDNSNGSWAPYSRPSNHPDLFEFPRFGIPPEFGGGIHDPNPALKGSGMFQAVETWLKTAKDVPTWRFQGMDPSSFWGMDQSVANKVWSCTVNDKTKIHGVMTTNAMAYSWSPPALVNGFLTYKVAGAHTDVDGSVYKGSYDLSMNIDSAKCIYGFTDAPIQATVSVAKADGSETQIASEVVAVNNGWLNLSAKNFTFSAPQIRIKLTQEGAKATPAPNTKAAAAPDKAAPVIAPTKTVIVCHKGKSIKKVAGINPQCPIGFKKK